MAQLVALGVLGLLVVVLAATGAYLWFRYLLSAGPGVYPEVDLWRRIHRWASGAVGTAAFVLLGLSAAAGLGRRRGERGRHAWVPALAVGVLVLAASSTGYLLPWDQLALETAEVGTGLRGVAAVFDDAVRFVLVSNVEVGVTTYRCWAVVHAVVLAVFIVVALGLLAWRSAASRSWKAGRQAGPAPRTSR